MSSPRRLLAQTIGWSVVVGVLGCSSQKNDGCSDYAKAEFIREFYYYRDWARGICAGDQDAREYALNISEGEVATYLAMQPCESFNVHYKPCVASECVQDFRSLVGQLIRSDDKVGMCEAANFYPEKCWWMDSSFQDCDVGPYSE